jgi:hypothetical protein
MDKFIPISTVFDKSEIIICIFLLIACGVVFRDKVNEDQRPFPGTELTYGFFIKTSAILRFQILAFFFPLIQQLYSLMGALFLDILPIVIYCIAIILIFGVIAFNIFNKSEPNYGSRYLNSHYHFESFENSWITLLAIGTGNVWTEVISAYSRGHSVGYGIMVDAFFAIFYFVFSTFFRTAPLVVIYKYVTHAKGGLGLSWQQRREFRFAWKELRNPKKVFYHHILQLIQNLPPPLGLKGRNYCYLDLESFAIGILKVMPLYKTKPGVEDNQALALPNGIPKNFDLRYARL